MTRAFNREDLAFLEKAHPEFMKQDGEPLRKALVSELIKAGKIADAIFFMTEEEIESYNKPLPAEPASIVAPKQPAPAVVEEHNECCICLDLEANILNEACNHKVMCVSCAANYASQENISCPICRAQITRLYLDTASAN